jgi:hypothetical protein
MMDKRNDWIGMWSAIGKDQGRMIELILDEDIQMRRKLKAKVIGQVRGVISPGQGNYLNVVPLGTQILHQFPIV